MRPLCLSLAERHRLVLQGQDGYLQKVAKALDRVRELSILSQDVTKSNADRSLYNAEFTQLSAYITSTGTKDFNGVSLFDGSTLNVVVDSDGNTFGMTNANLGAAAYTGATAASVATVAGATAALTAVKAAITQLSTDRATIGASQSRLNFTTDQLTVSAENLRAASSRIQDVDVAQESTMFAKQNILVQSGTAMLAQANQMPQSVLKLLQ